MKRDSAAGVAHLLVDALSVWDEDNIAESARALQTLSDEIVTRGAVTVDISPEGLLIDTRALMAGVLTVSNYLLEMAASEDVDRDRLIGMLRDDIDGITGVGN